MLVAGFGRTDHPTQVQQPLSIYLVRFETLLWDCIFALHGVCGLTWLHLCADFMHGKGIVNRDIKLDNTMLDLSTKPLVKITDLGLSKSVEDSAPKSLVGTPAYMGEPLFATS